jgi:hypothetical protein
MSETITEQWTGIHRHHYVIGILLQIERKIKLIDNWSNKTDTLRHRIQRTAGDHGKDLGEI